MLLFRGISDWNFLSMNIYNLFLHTHKCQIKFYMVKEYTKKD